jgi:uncharacterized membrane protein
MSGPPAAPSRRRADRPILRVLRRRRRLRAGLAQLIYTALALVIGTTLPRLELDPVVSGNRTSTMLFAIGGGMVTFIGLVYSMLFLVVQWASTSFTPRLNLFRDDPLVWHSFGFFVGALVFTLTSGLAIGGRIEVSWLVPAVGILTILAALALFRILQTRAFKSIQLAATLDAISTRGRAVLAAFYDELLPAEQGPPAGELPPVRTSIRWDGPEAVLQGIDLARLVRVAQLADAIVVVEVTVGRTILDGSVVVRVHKNPVERSEILPALTIGKERTFDQDPLLAFRLLVDIALRALSPALNDPTTATQVLDCLDSLLRIVARRDLAVGRVEDPDGALRVIVVLPTWDDYLALASDEIALASRSNAGRSAPAGTASRRPDGHRPARATVSGGRPAGVDPDHALRPDAGADRKDSRESGVVGGAGQIR